MSVIKDIKIKKILDSRGEPTIEVSVSEDGVRYFSASIPSGKSRGNKEAEVFSFPKAKKSILKIKECVRGMDFKSIGEIDKFLLLLDGTKDKSKLGGNVTLGISIAFARVLAFSNNKEVWRILRDEFFENVTDDNKPLIFSNLINGGAHAKSNLSIQEFIVVVKTEKSYVESIEALEKFYKELGHYLQVLTEKDRLSLGDEGGYALNFKNNFEPIKILENRIRSNKKSDDFALAIDCAASNFFKKGKYSYEGKKIKVDELSKKYKSYFEHSRLLMSVEDPFEETDEEDFRKLKDKFGEKWIVGDDLTVTDPLLIERYAKFGSINAVIIKPNQIGTVSEACEAMKIARDHGVKTIVSHRSGETEDDFIIHLAKAGGADGVKIGAPVRERALKFNELVRIFG